MVNDRMKTEMKYVALTCLACAIVVLGLFFARRGADTRTATAPEVAVVPAARGASHVDTSSSLGRRLVGHRLSALSESSSLQTAERVRISSEKAEQARRDLAELSDSQRVDLDMANSFVLDVIRPKVKPCLDKIEATGWVMVDHAFRFDEDAEEWRFLAVNVFDSLLPQKETDLVVGCLQSAVSDEVYPGEPGVVPDAEKHVYAAWGLPLTEEPHFDEDRVVR